MTTTVQHEKYQDLIARSAAAYNAMLWGFHRTSRSGHAHFEVFIDAEDGVSAELCLNVAKQIKIVFGAEGIERDSFTLDVSSPGLCREFFSAEQCSNFIGQKLACKFRSGESIAGVLVAVEAEQLQLLVAEKSHLEVCFSELKKISLIAEF